MKGVRFVPIDKNSPANANISLLKAKSMNIRYRDKDLEPIEKRLPHCDEKGDAGIILAPN